jgi:hypothetical protein
VLAQLGIGLTRVRRSAPESASSGLDGRPSATSELTGELLGRQNLQYLLLGGLPPCRRGDRNTPARLRILELRDVGIRLIAREFACRLTLTEPQRSSRIAEVGVSSLLEESQELFYL